MSHAKQPSRRKHRACAVPLLGAAGLSLSLASGASAVTPNTGMNEIALSEEEISDVTLATFYVFDKENAGTPRPDIQLAHRDDRGCHRSCHGLYCRGHCRGCRGC
jgi:hypothetical protein